MRTPRAQLDLRPGCAHRRPRFHEDALAHGRVRPDEPLVARHRLVARADGGALEPRSLQELDHELAAEQRSGCPGFTEVVGKPTAGIGPVAVPEVVVVASVERLDGAERVVHGDANRPGGVEHPTNIFEQPHHLPEGDSAERRAEVGELCGLRSMGNALFDQCRGMGRAHGRPSRWRGLCPVPVQAEPPTQGRSGGFGRVGHCGASTENMMRRSSRSTVCAHSSSSDLNLGR